MPGRYWQLVVFTVATQLAAGMVVVLVVCKQVVSGGASGSHAEGPASVVLEAVFVLLVLAVAVAVGHLGSFHSAIRAAANVRASWLSRETVAGVLFGLLVVAAALGYCLGLGSPITRRLCIVAAAAAGLVLVFAMARLYMLRTVPAWNTLRTPVSFLTATLLLGTVGLSGVLVVLGDSKPGVHHMLVETLPLLAWCCLLLMVIQLAVTACGAGDAPVEGFAASRAMWIVSALLGLGGAGFLLAVVNLAGSEAASNVQGKIAVVVAAAMVIASVAVGRYRFYASYHRVGL